MLLTAEQLRLFLKAMVNRVIAFRAEGLEHLPPEGGAILVCNHADLLDGLLVALFSGRRISFPGRQDVQESPVFGIIDRVFADIRDRIAPGQATIDLTEEVLDLSSQLLLDLGRMYPFAKKWLPAPLSLEDHHDRLAELIQAGHMVAVFPGHGFSRGRKPGHFDPAIGRLLLETRVPVIPAALYGTHGLSDMSRWVSGRNRGRSVLYRIGTPIKPELLPQKTNKNSARIWSAKMEEKVERLLRTAGKKREKKSGKGRPASTSRAKVASATLGETRLQSGDGETQEAALVGEQAELPFE